MILSTRPMLNARIVRSAPIPPRPRSRSARQAILWGALILAVANLSLAASVEMLLPQIRDPEFGVRLVRLQALQQAHPNRPLVVMIGTSRTQNGIAPYEMGFADEPGAPLVFNFGVSRAIPVALRLNLQRLHDADIRPNAVLIELLPATLSVKGPVDDQYRDQAAQLTTSDLRWLEPYVADRAALNLRWVAARLNPWPKHELVIKSHLPHVLYPNENRITNMWTKMDQRGFFPYPYEKTSDEFRERRRASEEKGYKAGLHDLNVSELSEQAVRGIVADCRLRGIEVAFYTMPESPSFRSWYSPESRARLAAFKAILRDELGCPVFERERTSRKKTSPTVTTCCVLVRPALAAGSPIPTSVHGGGTVDKQPARNVTRRHVDGRRV